MKTIVRILLALVSLLLAVTLAGTVLYTAALGTLRAKFTPEATYTFMESLDYAAIQLPDGAGSFSSLTDILNEQLGALGIRFSDDDLNAAIDTFSIDIILTSLAQDFRTWLLDYGPIPTIQPEAVAETILSGLDQTLVSYLSFFGDPVALLAESLSGLTSAADMTAPFREAAPARALLSAGTLVFVASLVATVFLLLLISRRLRLCPALSLAGASTAAAGGILLFAEPLLVPIKNKILVAASLPEATLDLVYRPFLRALADTGRFLTLAGLAACLLFALLDWCFSLVQREREKTAAARARREAMLAYNAAEQTPDTDTTTDSSADHNSTEN